MIKVLREYQKNTDTGDIGLLLVELIKITPENELAGLAKLVSANSNFILNNQEQMARQLGQYLITNIEDNKLAKLVNSTFDWGHLVLAINQKKWQTARKLSEALNQENKTKFAEYFLHEKILKLKKHSIEYYQFLNLAYKSIYPEKVKIFNLKALNIKNSKDKENIKIVIDNVLPNDNYWKNFFLLSLGEKHSFPKNSKFENTKIVKSLLLRYAFIYDQEDFFDQHLLTFVKESNQIEKEKIILDLIDDYFYLLNDAHPFYFLQLKENRKNDKKVKMFDKLIKSMNINKIEKIDSKKIDKFYLDNFEELYYKSKYQDKVILEFNNLLSFNKINIKNYFQINNETDIEVKKYHFNNFFNENLTLPDWQKIKEYLYEKYKNEKPIIQRMLSQTVDDNIDSRCMTFLSINDKQNLEKIKKELDVYLQKLKNANNKNDLTQLLIDYQIINENKNKQKNNFKI